MESTFLLPTKLFYKNSAKEFRACTILWLLKLHPFYGSPLFHQFPALCYILVLSFIPNFNNWACICLLWASLVAQMIKNWSAIQETWIRFLSQEDPLENGMVNHSSIIAWRLSRTEEPDGLQSMGSQRIRMTEELTLLLTFVCYILPLSLGSWGTVEMQVEILRIRSLSSTLLLSFGDLRKIPEPLRSEVSWFVVSNTCLMELLWRWMRYCMRKHFENFKVMLPISIQGYH